MLEFEWDEIKNKNNIKKHGISFEEAASVFQDDESLVIYDDEHSDEEDRFVLIGFSIKANLLVVCHCYRNSDLTIRIISARKADKVEKEQYCKK